MLTFLYKCEANLARFQSLSTSLTYLSDVHYAPLVQSAFQVNLQLIDCLHPPPYSPIDISEQRFDALCRLMKEGPQHILFFASEKPVFVTIAAQEVKQLTPRLGIAIVRFLQDLLHPLLGVLSFPAPPNTELGQDCIVVVCECIQALLTVTDACPPARRWRGAIISALLKCWIVTIEDGKGDTTRVQKALISLLTSLDQWDPNVCVSFKSHPLQLSPG